MLKKILLLFTLILAIGGFGLSLADVHNVRAQEDGYQIEVAIPSSSNPPDGKVSLMDYVQQIYMFALGLVGVAALTSLVIAGFRYMLSDTIDSKDAAKSMIWSALSGLILALAAYLILYTINPDLVNWKIIINR